MVSLRSPIRRLTSSKFLSAPCESTRDHTTASDDDDAQESLPANSAFSNTKAISSNPLPTHMDVNSEGEVTGVSAKSKAKSTIKTTSLAPSSAPTQRKASTHHVVADDDDDETALGEPAPSRKKVTSTKLLYVDSVDHTGHQEEADDDDRRNEQSSQRLRYREQPEQDPEEDWADRREGDASIADIGDESEFDLPARSDMSSRASLRSRMSGASMASQEDFIDDAMEDSRPRKPCTVAQIISCPTYTLLRHSVDSS